jgi:surface polysaccharide O-acyltransferase-like enzyme
MNQAIPNPGRPGPASAARNAYIDTLRGVSILGVVCIHFAGSFVTTDVHVWSSSFYLGLILNQVFIFAVPLFVFLSGLLAGASTKVVTLGDYYHSRFWRVGFPYLLASLASFFLLNHYQAWRVLPDFSAKLAWLAERVFLQGVEPTLYFIPLILQLYILQPALKALPRWLNGLAPGISPERFALVMAAALLVLHVVLGLLCYTGKLNYYVWGRPNPLFWMFYFFAGLHFRSLVGFFPPGLVKHAGRGALAVAALTMTWNLAHHTDPAVVGLNFERNILDFAYVRPEMLVYDLAMVLALAAGLTLGWSPRAGILSYLGRYTLEIYLWHILVLYYGAWRYADALAWCRQTPELIVVICAATALVIAGLADGLARLQDFVRHHRLALVKVP